MRALRQLHAMSVSGHHAGCAGRSRIRSRALCGLLAVRAGMFCRRDLHAAAHGAGVGRAPGILNPFAMPGPLLIENGTVLSTGGKPSVRRNCSVLIENGLITRVAPKNRFRRFAGRRLTPRAKW